jgi:hypothetical protein
MVHRPAVQRENLVCKIAVAEPGNQGGLDGPAVRVVNGFREGGGTYATQSETTFENNPLDEPEV